MTQSAALTALRKRHFALDALPNTIAIPVLALRKLYTLARQAGALGADRAVEAISDKGGR